MQFRGRSILTLLIALLLTLTCTAGAQSGTDEQQLRDLHIRVRPSDAIKASG